MTDDQFKKLVRDAPVKARGALDQHWAALTDDVLRIANEMRVSRYSELSADDVRAMSDEQLMNLARMAGIAFKEALTRKAETR